MRKINRIPYRRFGPVLFAIAALTLGACSSNDDDSEDTGTQTGSGSDTGGGEGSNSETPAADTPVYAFVSGATPTFDAGQIERLTLGDEIASSGTYPATLSDIVVRTDGTDVYQLGRFMIDSVTRFSAEELTTPTYQYSVIEGEEASPNPYDLVFVNDTKAYLVRYGSSKVWIVNPGAATADEFKIGEIDLSAYDSDSPNASDALLVGDRLYILMERLTGFNPDKAGYVAVFDTTNDTEIDTALGQDGLPGIALTSINPQSLQYVEATDEIFVVGRGNLFVEFNGLPGDPYSGGIESISNESDSFTLELLVDDGSDNENNGFFNTGIVATADRGYIVTTAGFNNNTLISYNPTTGVLDPAPIADLEGVAITTLAVGPEGRLWVGRGGDTPGFTLIDPADNSIAVDLVATQFVPNTVVFVGAGS